MRTDDGTNGTPRPANLALRPGLEDVVDRQVAILERLEKPLSGEDLRRWKRDVMHAAVGRINPGLRYLLYHADLFAVLEPLLGREDASGKEARIWLQDVLTAALSDPLADLSRITQEDKPRTPLAPAQLDMPNVQGPTWRRA